MVHSYVYPDLRVRLVRFLSHCSWLTTTQTGRLEHGLSSYVVVSDNLCPGLSSLALFFDKDGLLKGAGAQARPLWRYQIIKMGLGSTRCGSAQYGVYRDLFIKTLVSVAAGSLTYDQVASCWGLHSGRLAGHPYAENAMAESRFRSGSVPGLATAQAGRLERRLGG